MRHVGVNFDYDEKKPQTFFTDKTKSKRKKSLIYDDEDYAEI